MVMLSVSLLLHRETESEKRLTLMKGKAGTGSTREILTT